MLTYYYFHTYLNACFGNALNLESMHKSACMLHCKCKIVVQNIFGHKNLQNKILKRIDNQTYIHFIELSLYMQVVEHEPKICENRRKACFTPEYCSIDNACVT